MADTTRTLDEILTEARHEPPVMTMDDVQTLLANERTGASDNSINWRRYAMVGLLLAGAAVIALVIGTPSTDDARNASRIVSQLGGTTAHAPLGSTNNVATEPADTASTSSASSAPNHDGDVRRSGTRSASAAGFGSAMATTPTTGKTQWGYRFVKGQKLRYRLSSEFSQPAVGEAYTTTRILDIYVESVERDGRANLVITTLLDSIDHQSEAEMPDGLMVTRAWLPEVMRATISQHGAVMHGEIVRDSRLDSLKRLGARRITLESSLVEMVLNEYIPSLPEGTRLQPGNTVDDTVTSSYEIPSFDLQMKRSMVRIRDTTRSSYNLLEPRSGTSRGQLVMVVSKIKTSGTDGRGDLETQTTVEEIHLRAVDRIPTRAVVTTTTHDASVNASSSRATLELVEENWIGVPPVATPPMQHAPSHLPPMQRSTSDPHNLD